MGAVISSKFRKKAGGFTLAELMVGLVVGLLVILVIFELVTDFEGQKRTTTEGAGAQENGLYVVMTLERDMRMAGWGTSVVPLLGCQGQVNTSFKGAAIPGFSLMPVQITANGTAPDTVALTSGSGMLASTSNEVIAVSAGGNSDLGMVSAVGFKNDDLVVVANTDGSCNLSQVTNVDLAGSSIKRNPGSDFNPTPAVRASWPPEQVGAKIYNLGNLIRRTYSVDAASASLRAQDIDAPGGVSLADNIVSIKAQYGVAGVAGVGTGLAAQSVESWVNATGIWATPGPAEITRIKAVRLFVVARSPIREKPDATGGCSTTTVVPKPSWSDGDPVVIDLSANAEWQCFRYKSFQTVVPLRNVIWGMT